MRCAIYARYSSDMQKPESIDDQIRECKSYIWKRGWQVLEDHIYTDYAVSGANIDRKAYCKLKQMASRKEFDYIIVDDLSRLGRNTAESIATFSELSFLGIYIASVSEGIDTANRGAKMPFYFKSIMNEFYLDDLREKTVRGMRGQVERGYSPGGRLFGYRYTEVLDPSGAKDTLGKPQRIGVKIEIDPEQSKLVRKIFEMRTKGFGLKAIAKYLNEKEITPPRPEKANRISVTWASSTVRAILLNPKYVGDWTWGKTTWKKHPGTRKRKMVKLPQSEWFTSIREDLRIISDGLWAEVQKKRSQRKPLYEKNDQGQFTGFYATGNRGKYLFSGLLKCSICGGSMIVCNSRPYITYVCNCNWNRGEKACTNNFRVKKDILEKVLLAKIEEKLLNPQVVNRIVEKVNTKLRELSQTKPEKATRLNEEKKQLTKEIENLTEFILGGDTSQKVRELLKEKELELKTASNKLDGLKPNESRVVPVTSRWVRERLGNLRMLFSNYQEKIPLVRQELKNSLKGKITLRPVSKNGQRFYLAEGNGDPLSLLGSTVTVPLISHSGGRI